MMKRVTLAAVAGLSLLATAYATTGPFTGPLLNPWLSVDLNGGVASGTGQTTSPTEGWNGSFSSPSFSADQYGVTWSAWGGNAGAYGDGTQLPSSQSTPNINASSIPKTFGSYTATLSINTAVNSTFYSQVNSTASMNSRDRGNPPSTYSPAALSDTDMFRDLVFAGNTGTAIQGNNYLQLQLSGLNPGGGYRIALYSFDYTGSHSVNWTAIAPTVNGNGRAGWWNGTADNVFTAPSDEQTITWVGSGATQAPAILGVFADVNGIATVYGFGGNGITANQNADSSYLNGFQLIPEPSSLALLGLGTLLGAVALRRKKG